MQRLEGRSILVVEDEYFLAADLAQLLRRHGAEVLGPCPDERDALLQVEKRRPDCAVLDVKLGPGRGFGLADRLQALGVSFLFFTGYDEEILPQRFSGVVRLEKPMDDARLLDAIEKLCC